MLILEADRLYANQLRQLTLSVLPKAIIRFAPSVAGAEHELVMGPVGLLITGAGPSMAYDVLDFLSTCAEEHWRVDRVLVVTSHREHRQLSVLRSLLVRGVFDSANESPDDFSAVLRIVAAGGIYWSRTFLEFLQGRSEATTSPSCLLTAAEQLVLSIVGDGSDDDVAARKLGLSPATVSTVRRNLHRKLGVQHRGELIRFAAQNGFVRFTPTGVVRPGFALLAAACRQRKRQPVERLAI